MYIVSNNQESGVRRLKVYKDPLPYSDERIIELRGDKDKIGVAVKKIQELLLEVRCLDIM